MTRRRNDATDRLLDRVADLTLLRSCGAPSIADARAYEGQDANSNPRRHALCCAMSDAVRALRSASPGQWTAIVADLRSKLDPSST